MIVFDYDLIDSGLLILWSGCNELPQIDGQIATDKGPLLLTWIKLSMDK